MCYYTIWQNVDVESDCYKGMMFVLFLSIVVSLPDPDYSLLKFSLYVFCYDAFTDAFQVLGVD